MFCDILRTITTPSKLKYFLNVNSILNNCFVIFWACSEVKQTLLSVKRGHPPFGTCRSCDPHFDDLEIRVKDDNGNLVDLKGVCRLEYDIGVEIWVLAIRRTSSFLVIHARMSLPVQSSVYKHSQLSVILEYWLCPVTLYIMTHW